MHYPPLQESSPMWPGVIEAYRSYLPFDEGTPIITLNEGNTPLIHAPRLAEAIAPGSGLRLFLKYEGLNPTGSFKDRGMTAAITQAVREGAETVICASTGNTAASAAAYAARAGLRCLVLVPQGKIALGKLAASLAYGADVISIDGSFDDGLRMVREITERRPIALVNSVNPWRLEGQKTGAFEIVDQLGGQAPDWHCLPVGNAGNISAYWLGYKQYGRGLPRLLGGQAAGAAPIVLGRVVENPETLATAIRIGNPARWRQAVEALDESGGIVTAVSDEDILEAWRMLARIEGVFVEPASATGLAALRQQIARGEIDAAAKTAVIVLTGHGLKDPGTAVERAGQPVALPAKIEALEAYLTK
ncbi:MAG: threonine synthase [Anaerolineales bacterium]|uniref:threonine synthase n=1 Tax=Promineifilum sp. TaxID=2664178 RepID=UPI001D9F42F6|nr:threonine synthase [Anaerolineales bacterium]MCO5178910.1 threonine synthase [Promineifilum sp.]